MLSSSKKDERAMEEEKADRGMVEEEKEEILGKGVKEAKQGEQCFICDAPAVFNCPACSQVPICEHHRDYHQARPIFSVQSDHNFFSGSDYKKNLFETEIYFVILRSTIHCIDIYY